MICPGCGAEFAPKRSNHRRCSPNCGRQTRARGDKHKTRRERGVTHNVEFVGVDGEGVTRDDGTHDYILLTVGDAHLHRDGERLALGEILDFLYLQFLARPRAAFVGFYLGYDFAQWFRGLPHERAARLLSPKGIASRRRMLPHLPPFPVEWEGWEIDTLATRRLKLRPSDPARYGLPAPDKAPWLTICDCGAFFQCSFLKAIDPAKATAPVVTPAEYAVIAAGKDGRRSHVFGRDMMRYNMLECEVLARLMAQQNRGLVEEGIRLRRNQWIGPGQAAQQWLRHIGAPLSQTVRERTDPLFRDAARMAYFGGWFEIVYHGLVEGSSYGYDINSAYPKIMSQLPCLLHGRYTSQEEAWTLVKAKVSGCHPVLGAALHRTRRHTVLRPRQTSGWFWLHELAASQAAGFIDKIELEEARGYRPCSCAPPLAAIAELYEGRLKIGKNSPAGKARKLIYNSAYGKHAQSVGEPVFGNAIYASMITAGCRKMIVDAIASHPHGAQDLLMVATDSVTFRTPHTMLDIDSQRLGAWTGNEHRNLSLFMPGVYWDDDTRARLSEGDDPALKSRGIAARDLARRIDRLDKAWNRFPRDGWPRLIIPIGFQLISPRQALARNDWTLCGRVVTNGRRIISADPVTKRLAGSPGRSLPYMRAGELASTPYEEQFGEEAAEIAEGEFGDHPDMPIVALLPALFRG